MWELLRTVAAPRLHPVDGIGSTPDLSAFMKLQATTKKIAAADVNKDNALSAEELKKQPGLTDSLKKDAVELQQMQSPELQKATKVLEKLKTGAPLDKNDVKTLQDASNTILAKLNSEHVAVKGANLVVGGPKLEVTGKPQPDVFASFTTSPQHKGACDALTMTKELQTRIKAGEDDAKAQLSMQVSMVEYGNQLQYQPIQTNYTPDWGKPVFKQATEISKEILQKNGLDPKTSQYSWGRVTDLMNPDRQAGIKAVADALVADKKMSPEEALKLATQMRDDYEKNAIQVYFPTPEAQALRSVVEDACKQNGISYSMDKAAAVMNPHKDPATAIAELAEIIKKENPGMPMDKCIAAATQVRAAVDDHNQAQIKDRAATMYEKELGGNPAVFEVQSLAVGNMSLSSGLSMVYGGRGREFVGLFNNNYNGTLLTENGKIKYEPLAHVSPGEVEKLAKALEGGKDNPALRKELAAKLRDPKTSSAEMVQIMGTIKSKFNEHLAQAERAIKIENVPSFVNAQGSVSTYTAKSTGTLDKDVQSSMTIKPMGVNSSVGAPSATSPHVTINVPGSDPLVIVYQQQKGKIVATVEKPANLKPEPDGTFKLKGGMSFNPNTGVLNFGPEMKGKTYSIETSVKAYDASGASDDFAIVTTKTMTPKFTSDAVDAFDSDKITVKPGSNILSDKEIQAIADNLKKGGKLEFTSLVGNGVNPEKSADYKKMRVSEVAVDTSGKDIKISINSYTDPERSLNYSKTPPDPNDKDGNIALSHDRSVASAINIVQQLKTKFQDDPGMLAKLNTVEADLQKKLIKP